MKTSLITLLALVLSSCATQYGARYLPDAEHALDDPYGVIVHVTLYEDAPVEGELLAISSDSVFVADPLGFRAIAKASVHELLGNTFDRGDNVITYSVATIVGMLGSISAGAPGIVFIMPLYLVLGTISTVSASNISRISYASWDNAEQWNALAKWARFPAGLPKTLHRDFVHHRPTTKY